MATAKTLADQIKNIETELQQKENRLKRLREQHKVQESKERTRRLIERGAIVESLIEGATDLTNEQIKSFLLKTVQTDFAGKILKQIKEQPTAEIDVNRSTPKIKNSEDTGEKSETEQVTLDGD